MRDSVVLQAAAACLAVLLTSQQPSQQLPAAYPLLQLHRGLVLRPDTGSLLDAGVITLPRHHTGSTESPSSVGPPVDAPADERPDRTDDEKSPAGPGEPEDGGAASPASRQRSAAQSAASLHLIGRRWRFCRGRPGKRGQLG